MILTYILTLPGKAFLFAMAYDITESSAVRRYMTPSERHRRTTRITAGEGVHPALSAAGCRVGSLMCPKSEVEK